MKKQLCLLVICMSFLMMVPLFVSAQNNNDNGINWANGLTWEQVKQKAKAENKYIFIDVYTTWCGPCKMMDKNVYSNDTVSKFFNENFIAVKAQMDKTEKDQQSIKDWYKDAARFHEEFGINSYPTFVFLSPQADILQKETGYRPVQKFISIAKEALSPDKINNNPFKEYRTLVNDYKQGIKHYDRMPFMINKAFELNDDALAREMFKDHLSHATTLSENERYTKENIQLWSAFVLKLDSKALPFFLRDYDRIDQIMGEKGLSKGVVDAAIQARIVDSFFRMQKGEATITDRKFQNSEVMFIRIPDRADGKIGPDLSEADWKQLRKMILKHFSEDYAVRNVFSAKIRWYWKHKNMTGVSKTYFKQLAKYPPADLKKESEMVNEVCWQTFLYSNDKKLLNKALVWSDRLMHLEPLVPGQIDTYANLLYKLGRAKEAISWEEKAIELHKKSEINTWTAETTSEFQLALDLMKKGEPTYLNEGAIWQKGK